MEKKAKVPKLRFPGFTGEWEERKLREVMERYEKPVVTPHTGYNRLGIRSHAKGTFHNHVEAGEELETAQMYEVVANNFIVNITFAWEHAVAITDKDDTGKLVSHRFPQFQFTAGNIPCFFKYVIADPRFKYHLGLASPGGAGRNRVLNINEMLKYVVRVPAREEQEQIGKFLGKVDENILFYQRKLTHLQAKKKCLLQKMFPKKGERFPELRFPGFTDDWEQRKLGDLFDMSISNNTLSRAELTNDIEEVRNIHYGDVLIRYSAVLDIANDNVPYIKGAKVAQFSKYLLQDGDIVVADTAEDETAGKVVEIDDIQGFPIVAGLHTIVCRPVQRFASKYLGYYMNSGIFHQQILPLMQGTKVTSINRGSLLGIEMKYPVSKDEQQKIGEFFKSLDNLINLHQRKLIHLQTQKKALLQQMFV